jgi:hypothetical protein
MTESRVRLLAAALLVASAFAFAPIPFGGSTAEAGYGTARRSCRRTARRTSRRVTARRLYALPAGHTTVVVSGATYYVVDGVKYKAVIVDGKTAYVPVEG